MFEKTGNIKEYNQEKILYLLRKYTSLTKQEIGQALGLSMPTTLQNVNEMLEKGILEEGGATESTGGRRAMKIQVNRKAAYFVGIDITTNSVKFASIDLNGEVIGSRVIPIAFRDEPEVYEKIGSELDDFLKRGRIKSKVVGVGISFPGIIDMREGRIMRSHIFNLEYVSLDRFCKAIPYPIIVENDANCMSYSELTADVTDYVYLSLNPSVGGALMQDGKLVKGNGFRAGEVGHMILVPGGRTCYCGKEGCADAYLSPKALTREYSTLESFFQALQEQEGTAIRMWDNYLNHLAILVSNLRMVLDMDVIIGGEVGSFLPPYMDELCTRTLKYDRFARDVDYIKPCSKTDLAGAAGAALLALDQFAASILN